MGAGQTSSGMDLRPLCASPPPPQVVYLYLYFGKLETYRKTGKNRTVNTHMASHESLIINIVATLALCLSVCICFLSLLIVSCTSRHFTPVSVSTYLPGTRTVLRTSVPLPRPGRLTLLCCHYLTCGPYSIAIYAF